MISRDIVNKITDAAQIKEVVAEFVTLKKAGSNYKGLCPFHRDSSYSFMVSPAKNYCKCFACGEGGNPVGFIMKYKELSYPDALRWLADKYQIEIQEGTSAEMIKENKLYNLNPKEIAIVESKNE